MTEAAAQFQKGLDQLATLPQDPKRQRQELEFYTALGAVMIAVKGYAAPETGQTYARAQDLWEQLGFPSEFLRIPYGQAVIQAARGEVDLALRSDEDLLRLSRSRNDFDGLVLGLLSFGRDLLFAGRFALSRSPLEEVLALYDPISHPSLVHQAGIHPQAQFKTSASALGGCEKLHDAMMGGLHVGRIELDEGKRSGLNGLRGVVGRSGVSEA